MNAYVGDMFDHAVSRDPDSGVSTIVVWGPLGPGYPTRLNGLVRKILAERPRAILLDLNAVTPPDGVLAIVLTVLNRAVAKDGARLIVTAGPSVTSTLTLAARRELSLYADRSEALRAAVLALAAGHDVVEPAGRAQSQRVHQHRDQRGVPRLEPSRLPRAGSGSSRPNSSPTPSSTPECRSR
jgi:hypothetical protein